MGASIYIPAVSNVRVIVPKTFVAAGVNNLQVPIPALACDWIRVLFKVRSLAAAVAEVAFLRLNGDATNNYDATYTQSSGGVDTPGTLSGASSMGNFNITANSGLANALTTYLIDLTNINDANRKDFHYTVDQVDLPGFTDRRAIVSGKWRNTVPITTVDLKLTAANFNTLSWYQVVGYMNS